MHKVVEDRYFIDSFDYSPYIGLLHRQVYIIIFDLLISTSNFLLFVNISHERLNRIAGLLQRCGHQTTDCNTSTILNT